MLYNFLQMQQKFPFFNYQGFLPQNPLYFPMNFPSAPIRQEILKPQMDSEDQMKKEALVEKSEKSEKLDRISSRIEASPNQKSVVADIEDRSVNIEKTEGIQMILKYFIQNIGRVRSNRINVEREKFAKNAELLQIFDLLMKKYIMSNKTKEEKIKYILRKSFKYLGNKLKKEQFIAKNLKSKKEFDRIFNDFYMSSKQSLEEKEAKVEGKQKFKLVFT